MDIRERRGVSTSLQTPMRLSGNISCIFCRRMSILSEPSIFKMQKNIHIICIWRMNTGGGGGARYHIGGFGESMRFLFIVAFGAVEPFPAFIWIACVSALILREYPMV